MQPDVLGGKYCEAGFNIPFYVLFFTSPCFVGKGNNGDTTKSVRISDVSAGRLEVAQSGGKGKNC